ncbi:MAG: pirin family protein [Acidimicrobiales bacterium]|nr:pirin family protein [Acidimicrobiales bacterium]
MDAIELEISPRERNVGSSTVQRLLPVHHRRMVGPFIFLDRMGPRTVPAGRRLDIDAHPHIGLSTLTYLIEGRMVHRDSTGAVATIEPGAVNWMTAGAGVSHTERTHPDDLATDRGHHGLQLWVALPDDAQDGPPSFQHQPAEAFGTEAIGGAAVRVVAGAGYGVEAPVAVSSPLLLAELALGPGASVPVDDTHPERAVLAIDADVWVDGHRLPAGALGVLSPGATPRLSGEGRAVLLGGEPVGRRHIWWNFVHADRDRIEAAKADWQAQRFPLVPGDHDPWIPLPGP